MLAAWVSISVCTETQICTCMHTTWIVAAISVCHLFPSVHGWKADEEESKRFPWKTWCTRTFFLTNFHGVWSRYNALSLSLSLCLCLSLSSSFLMKQWKVQLLTETEPTCKNHKVEKNVRCEVRDLVWHQKCLSSDSFKMSKIFHITKFYVTSG